MIDFAFSVSVESSVNQTRWRGYERDKLSNYLFVICQMRQHVHVIDRDNSADLSVSFLSELVFYTLFIIDTIVYVISKKVDVTIAWRWEDCSL